MTWNSHFDVFVYRGNDGPHGDKHRDLQSLLRSKRSFSSKWTRLGDGVRSIDLPMHNWSGIPTTDSEASQVLLKLWGQLVAVSVPIPWLLVQAHSKSWVASWLRGFKYTVIINRFVLFLIVEEVIGELVLHKFWGRVACQESSFQMVPIVLNFHIQAVIPESSQIDQNDPGTRAFILISSYALYTVHTVGLD